ncbi:hypothetical protein CMK18_13290 [Candidatus Poribacteria bacterium]|nr:hypothetical protein [Candidatus Poribacteria bacterium]
MALIKKEILLSEYAFTIDLSAGYPLFAIKQSTTMLFFHTCTEKINNITNQNIKKMTRKVDNLLSFT